MSVRAGTLDHILVYTLAEAGTEGRPLSRVELIEEVAIKALAFNFLSYLVDVEGKRPREAEREIQKNSVAVHTRAISHAIDGLVSKGWVVETNGHVQIGELPKGYDPMKVELDAAQINRAASLRDARRSKGGWSNWWTLETTVVDGMVRDMAEHGWPKGLTVLLDADGQIADGKHRIQAAESLGIDWREHAVTLEDEFLLAEEVRRRNADRNWNMTPQKVARVAAALNTDLPVTELVRKVKEDTGVSERTAQRATKDLREAAKKERDEKIASGLAEGKSQRQVAAEVGASHMTAGRVAHSRHTGENVPPDEPPARKKIGPCAICRMPMYEDEKLGWTITPGLLSDGTLSRLGEPVRESGGSNQLYGTRERGEKAHAECFSLAVQEHWLVVHAESDASDSEA